MNGKQSKYSKNYRKKSTSILTQRAYRILLSFFLVLPLLAPLLANSQSNSVGKVFEGNASWYGEPFHGRKTASGEIYDMNLYTAAHKTLPFGTYIRVTNIQNNRSLVVKINDRGPFIEGRVLDLSRRSAQDLGFLEEGVVPVRIELLGTDAPPQYSSNSQTPLENSQIPNLNPGPNENSNMNALIDPFPQGKPSANRIQASQVYVIELHRVIKKTENPQYKLQLGAYTNIESAFQQRIYYDQEGIQSYLCTFSGSSNIFRILSKESFSTLNQAITYQNTLRNQGVQGFVLEF